MTLPVTLAGLKKGFRATIERVEHRYENDPISRRLRHLGFVPGEEVVMIAHGPLGMDPVLIQIGFTRFALRREEAGRVHVTEVSSI